MTTTATMTLSSVRFGLTLGQKMETVKKKFTPLLDRWSFYYHLPDDTHWDISSYVLLISGISDPEQLTLLNETISDVIVKNAMMFVMRQGIQPIWEDERNAGGGYLSFKVVNKNVYHVWKSMVYAVCGQTFFSCLEDNQYINGLSISPKKTFCIIKVWLCDGSKRNSTITPILHLATDQEELKYTSFQEQISADTAK